MSNQINQNASFNQHGNFIAQSAFHARCFSFFNQGANVKVRNPQKQAQIDFWFSQFQAQANKKS